MIAIEADPVAIPCEDAARWYRAHLLAAGYLLRHWQAKGARSVRLERNDDGEDRVEPDVVNGAAGWAPDAAEAAAMLVATVLLGARYLGWTEAVQAAAAEMGGEA
jgi:hypothetical protein